MWHQACLSAIRVEVVNCGQKAGFARGGNGIQIVVTRLILVYTADVVY
jgi:hypothetical protein